MLTREDLDQIKQAVREALAEAGYPLRPRVVVPERVPQAVVVPLVTPTVPEQETTGSPVRPRS